MPYYMGDFYTGDPGIGSFLGKVFGGVAKKLPFVGPLIGGISALAKKPGTAIALPAAAGVATTGIVRSMGGAITAGAASAGRLMSKHPVLSAAAAAGAIGVAGMGMGRAAGERVGVGMKGFHISRRTGQVVRNRRMHVTNPKALRRAIRRAQGFAHLAKRVLRFTSPRAPRGRAVFKARRRTKRI